MRAVSSLLVIGLAFALPHVAHAGSGHTPPGNSGVGQYLESVPGAGGNHPSPSAGGGDATSGGNSASAVPPGTSRALSSRGSAGQAAVNLANATAPRERNRAGNGGRASPRSENGRAAAAPGSGAKGIVDELVSSNPGSGAGMGIMLPIILVLTAVAAVLTVLVRRHRRTKQIG